MLNSPKLEKNGHIGSSWSFNLKQPYCAISKLYNKCINKAGSTNNNALFYYKIKVVEISDVMKQLKFVNGKNVAQKCQVLS